MQATATATALPVKPSGLLVKSQHLRLLVATTPSRIGNVAWNRHGSVEGTPCLTKSSRTKTENTCHPVITQNNTLYMASCLSPTRVKHKSAFKWVSQDEESQSNVSSWGETIGVQSYFISPCNITKASTIQQEGRWGNRVGTLRKQPSLAMYDLMGLRLSEPDQWVKGKKIKGRLI